MAAREWAMSWRIASGSMGVDIDRRLQGTRPSYPAAALVARIAAESRRAGTGPEAGGLGRPELPIRVPPRLLKKYALRTPLPNLAAGPPAASAALTPRSSPPGLSQERDDPARSPPRGRTRAVPI